MEPNEAQPSADARQWFVMRDLKRWNAILPAYKMLKQMDIECFTPMVQKIVMVKGRRENRDMPYMSDLLFVHATRRHLDPIVDITPTLQYRFVKGAAQKPMVVRTADMERFICAVQSTDSPRFYTPAEVTPDMCNRQIRIIGGNLDGYTGTLVTTRGSKTKRLLVELPTLLAAAVEVEAEYIQLV